MAQTPKSEQRESVVVKPAKQIAQPQYREPAEALVSDENLDIPAFLRKRKFQ
jgi:hypothetical protein